MSCFSLLSCPRPRRARTHGRRLLFDRFHPLRESGICRIIFLCRACVYTSTFTQKIQCTFKVDIPDMGHLDGGHERDVRTALPNRPPHASLSLSLSHIHVRSKPKARSNCRSGSPSFSSIRAFEEAPTHGNGHFTPRSPLSVLCRDYADFTVPPPFSSRVRNALNAEAKSVRLSALVGAGGLWYGFGKIIMRLSVPSHHIVGILPRF